MNEQHPNQLLQSQEEGSVIIIDQCYDVVIDYNIFQFSLGSPSASLAQGPNFYMNIPSLSLSPAKN